MKRVIVSPICPQQDLSIAIRVTVRRLRYNPYSGSLFSRASGSRASCYTLQHLDRLFPRLPNIRALHDPVRHKDKGSPGPHSFDEDSSAARPTSLSSVMTSHPRRRGADELMRARRWFCARAAPLSPAKKHSSWKDNDALILR